MSIHNYSLIPEIVEALDRYIMHGIPTGSFLRAFLANDLEGALCLADDNNLRLFPVIGSYIYNNCSRNCRGSYQIVDDWIKTKRAMLADKKDD